MYGKCCEDQQQKRALTKKMVMVEQELGQDQTFFDMCKEDLVNHIFIQEQEQGLMKKHGLISSLNVGHFDMQNMLKIG